MAQTRSITKNSHPPQNHKDKHNDHNQDIFVTRKENNNYNNHDNQNNPPVTKQQFGPINGERAKFTKALYARKAVDRPPSDDELHISNKEPHFGHLEVKKRRK